MNVLIVLVPLAILIASFFLFAFIKATKSGQYDDLDTPAYKMLLDDEKYQTNDSDTNNVKKEMT